MNEQIAYAAGEVWQRLQSGWSESFYQRALAAFLEGWYGRGCTQLEVPVAVYAFGERVGTGRADLVWHQQDGAVVVLEIKRVTALLDTHRAQLFAYMRELHTPYGALINFPSDDPNDRKEPEVEVFFRPGYSAQSSVSRTTYVDSLRREEA